MGFGDAVVAGFRGFATFRGRARRSEFWWFQAFAAAVWAVTMPAAAALWVAALSGETTPTEDPAIDPASVAWGWLTLAAGLVLLYGVLVGVPALAVSARRLHDVDMSAWWLLLAAAGLGVVIAVIALRPGHAGATRFGPDPRHAVPAPARVV